MELLNTILLLVICHMIGDYFLQADFIASTKGKNWYHLIVHCMLYVAPFIFVFGLDWRIYILLISHIIIDPLKARYNKITYVQDQALHYLMIGIYFI